PAARDRRVRVALDLDDLLILDVDLLAAADRAVRTDRLDHLVGRPGPRHQLVRANRLSGPAEAVWVPTELTQERNDQPALVHPSANYPSAVGQNPRPRSR